jgi:hypothetical protein
MKNQFKNVVVISALVLGVATLSQAQVTSADGTFKATGTTANLTLMTLTTTPRLTIHYSSGNTGVGVVPTGTSQKFEVNGNALATQIWSSSGTFNSAGTNNLALATNGTERFTIHSASGNVGIGVVPTGTSQKFEVNGNGQATQLWATSGTFNSAGSANLTLATNATARFTIHSISGNVGIGLVPTATSQKFEVNGNALATQLWSSSGIFNSTATSIALATSGTPRLTVLNSGNVGIGTATPSEALQVTGNAMLSGNLIVNSGANPILYTGIGASELNRYYQIVNSAGLANPSGLKAGGLLVADNFAFANPSKNDLIVKGRVGIGTPLAHNTNEYELAVNGNIGTKDVQIEGNSDAWVWPDYVFKKEYKLPTLASVAAYIDANNHLPEVPSATTVKEDGYSMSEMDVTLLKKVEELTLYIIEQQKQIDELKKRLDDK